MGETCFQVKELVPHGRSSTLAPRSGVAGQGAPSNALAIARQAQGAETRCVLLVAHAFCMHYVLQFASLVTVVRPVPSAPSARGPLGGTRPYRLRPARAAH